MNNHMPGKVWDEITYPLSNFNGATVEVKKWISNLFPHLIMGELFSMAVTKSILVKGPKFLRDEITLSFNDELARLIWS